MGILDDYEDGAVEDLLNIKEDLESVREKIIGIFEDYDTYDWHHDTKYFLADLNALQTLVSCSIEQVDEIIENHCEEEDEDEDGEEYDE